MYRTEKLAKKWLQQFFKEVKYNESESPDFIADGMRFEVKSINPKNSMDRVKFKAKQIINMKRPFTVLVYDRTKDFDIEPLFWFRVNELVKLKSLPSDIEMDGGGHIENNNKLSDINNCPNCESLESKLRYEKEAHRITKEDFKSAVASAELMCNACHDFKSKESKLNDKLSSFKKKIDDEAFAIHSCKCEHCQNILKQLKNSQEKIE